MSSLPRLLPSLEMGEYSPPQERPEDGGLYPLEEEGTYGRVPKRKSAGRWSSPQAYVRRERRTKMYASYAISDKCELHSLLLDKYDMRSSHERRSSRSSHDRRQARVGRAASVPPEYQKQEDGVPSQHQRGESLPPYVGGGSGDIEDLDMINKLKLSKEVELDTMESLRSVMGEGEKMSAEDTITI